MKKSTRNIAINALLVFCIALILWIGSVVFIGGPSRLYEDQDAQYVLKFIENEDYEEAQMVSRFSFDSVYYIVEAKKDEKVELAWFDTTFTKKGSHELVLFDAVFELADSYGVDHGDISFGVYKNELVYVLRKRDNFEVFISVDTLETVFSIGGIS